MNFNVFGAARNKQKTTSRTAKFKTKFHSGQTIVDVIATTPVDELEELVCKHFQTILKFTPVEQFHYFTMHKSWKEKFIANSFSVFNSQKHLEAYNVIIESFPELEADVYEFLLDGCLDDSLDCELREEITIHQDILMPMIYMERYFGARFPQIRYSAKEILEATTTFYDFYATASVLENELENTSTLSKENLEKIIDEVIHETLDAWLCEELSKEDFSSLIGYFRSSEAYDIFMKKLYELFAVHGLDLYKFLISEIGPRYEILNYEYDCFEFSNI